MWHEAQKLFHYKRRANFKITRHCTTHRKDLSSMGSIADPDRSSLKSLIISKHQRQFKHLTSYASNPVHPSGFHRYPGACCVYGSEPVNSHRGKPPPGTRWCDQTLWCLRPAKCLAQSGRCMGTEQRPECHDHLRTRTILVPKSTGGCRHHLGNIRTINDSISAIISPLPFKRCCPNLSTSCHHRCQGWKPTPHSKVRGFTPARLPHRRHRRIWNCQYLGHGHLGRHSWSTGKSGGCQALSPEYRGFFNGFWRQL